MQTCLAEACIVQLKARTAIAPVFTIHGAKQPPIQGLYLSTEDSTRMQPLYWRTCAKSITLQSGMTYVVNVCVCVVCVCVCVCV